MRIRQPLLILIILTAALNTPPATHGQTRENELRPDIAAAFEIVSKAERGGVDVMEFHAALDAGLPLIGPMRILAAEPEAERFALGSCFHKF